MDKQDIAQKETNTPAGRPVVTDLELAPFGEKLIDDQPAVPAALVDELNEEAFIKNQCALFQKRRTYVVGPLMLLIAAVSWGLMGTWQLGFISSVLVVTNVAFMVALKVAKRGHVEQSLWLALIPTLAVSAVVIVLIEGFETVMILTSIAVVVQISVFSSRLSLVGSAVIFGFVVIDKFIDSFGVFERLAVSSTVEFVAAGIIGMVMMIQFYVYLHKHRDNNRTFLARANTMNQHQERVIDTFSKILPTLNDSVGQIRQVADDVSRKSTAQAASMMEMKAVVAKMRTSSEKTAQAAKDTHQLSSETRHYLSTNATRLVDMEERFRGVERQIDNARQVMQELLAKTDQVESILAYNRDIGEHIKVLSVNASIEAAEAGEAGHGFGVVARELREMIDNTEGNLSATRTILNDIRSRSQVSMNAIASAGDTLGVFRTELQDTLGTLQNSVNSFDRVQSQVQQISLAAGEQQAALGEVATGVSQLQSAAAELADGAKQLISTVEDIVTSRDSMSLALGDK